MPIVALRSLKFRKADLLTLPYLVNRPLPPPALPALFRRSLYVAQDMHAGEVFTAHNLRSVRPGFGLAPKYLDSLLGQRVGRAVHAGTPMAWDLLSKDPVP